MTTGTDREAAERMLVLLDEEGWLFPQFRLARGEHGEAKLLGQGGFSSVYEMYNKERPELKFALKVTGLERHTVSSEEFWDRGRIQWILGQNSPYVVRVMALRELAIALDETGAPRRTADASGELWEEEEQSLRLQLVLMEKLDRVLVRDRFHRAFLLKEMMTERDVIRFALQIGQALLGAHEDQVLHRDIKLENIFWDEREQIYKLGDFGIAKFTEDGNAETIVYTDGYGAPEIERRSSDCYNATADIYSFGIVLYLLLNDLKFPGSEGYYPKTEIQYDPDFVFPAPGHATPMMSRVIRKMCSYRPQDRYQTMAEVLSALVAVGETEEIEVSDELAERIDMATETYRQESEQEKEPEQEKERDWLEGKTRADRIRRQRATDAVYRDESIKFFVLLTPLAALLLKGLQPGGFQADNRLFLALPVVVAVEALLQRVGEFHLLFGLAAAGGILLSAYRTGLTAPHVLLLLAVLVGCPLVAASGALGTALWMADSVWGGIPFLDFIVKLDLGWVLLCAFSLVLYRYFHMRIDWGKTTEVRGFLSRYIYDKIYPVAILAGIVLVILEKTGVVAIPEAIRRMHLIRTGVVCFVAMVIFAWWDGYLDNESVEKQ